MINVRCLLSVRLHCIDNREDSVLEISGLAQANFQNSLSVSSVEPTMDF